MDHVTYMTEMREHYCNPVDVQLKSINIKSRITDVFEFLNYVHKIQLQPGTNYHLVSADSVSMYLSMDIEDTIKTVRAYLLDFFCATIQTSTLTC